MLASSDPIKLRTLYLKNCFEESEKSKWPIVFVNNKQQLNNINNNSNNNTFILIVCSSASERVRNVCRDKGVFDDKRGDTFKIRRSLSGLPGPKKLRAKYGHSQFHKGKIKAKSNKN